jgi:hypothetical protein
MAHEEGGVISTDGSGSDNVMNLPGGTGVSARLLLALTGLYTKRTIHTEEEQQQYAELALRLIARVDTTARATVAATLRDHGSAPPVVLAALEEADAMTAEPLLTSSATLQSSASGEGPIDHQPIQVFVDTQETVAISHYITPIAIPAEETTAGDTEDAAPAELAKAFFAAAPAERQSILSRMEGDPDAYRAPDPAEAKRRCEALDIAAIEGRIGEFIREFERLLGVPKSLCERIVNDSSGEPMVVAAKAVNMPAAVLQRILLLVNPAIGCSVQRVFHLTDLFHDLDRARAAKLLSLWNADAPPNPEVRIDVLVRKPREASAAGTAGLARRFGALGERIGEVRRSVPESAARRDHRSR